MANFTLPLNVACDGQNLTFSIPLAELTKLVGLLSVPIVPAIEAPKQLRELDDLADLPPVPMMPKFQVGKLTLTKFADKGKAMPWVTRSLRPWASGLRPDQTAEFLQGEAQGDKVTFRLRSGEIYYVHSPQVADEFTGDKDSVFVDDRRIGWTEYYCCVDGQTGRVNRLSRQEAQSILKTREAAEQQEDGGW